MKKQTINLNDYKALKLAYFKALEENSDTFIFKGQEVLTSYAKYLIQHLETKKSKQK